MSRSDLTITRSELIETYTDNDGKVWVRGTDEMSGPVAGPEGYLWVNLPSDALARLAAQGQTAEAAASRLLIRCTDSDAPEAVTHLAARAIAARLCSVDGGVACISDTELQEQLETAGVPADTARDVTDALRAARIVAPADEALGSFGIAAWLAAHMSHELSWRP